MLKSTTPQDFKVELIIRNTLQALRCVSRHWDDNNHDNDNNDDTDNDNDTNGDNNNHDSWINNNDNENDDDEIEIRKMLQGPGGTTSLTLLV